MRKQILLSSSLVLTALLAVGCTKATEPTTDTTTPVASDVVTVADAPEGCPSSNTLTVQSEEAGTVTMQADNSYFVQWGESAANLVFANYEVNPDSIYGHTYTDSDVLVVVKLGNTDPDDEFVTGTYVKDDAATLQSSEYNISTVNLAGAVFNDSDQVELSYVGGDYVCGTVTSDDGSSSIKGDFIAKYHEQEI